MSKEKEINGAATEDSHEVVRGYEQLKSDGHKFTADEIYDWTAHQRIIDGE